jgi:NAD+ synthase
MTAINNEVQRTVIEQLKVIPVINEEYEFERRVEFVMKYLTFTGRNALVLGISGGQDSTLGGKICQTAVDRLNIKLGNKNYKFVAVRLPYGEQTDEVDAQKALEFINPTITITYDIKPAVDTAMERLNASGVVMTDFLKGNRKARERMVAQYDIAGAANGLVVGTDHAAEAITGFYTKYGDGAADIAPLFGLNKGQGKEILAYLGCPQELYLKVPTADLEDNKPGIPDEVALGYSYDDIDTYLTGGNIDPVIQTKLEGQYAKTEHKRQGPVTVNDEWWKTQK